MSDAAIDAQARRWGVELPVAIRRYLRVAGDPDTPATLPELWIGASKDPRAPLRFGDTGMLIQPLVDGGHQLWWSTPTETVPLRQDFAGLLQRIVARAIALQRIEHGERCEVPELVDTEWLEPTA